MTTTQLTLDDELIAEATPSHPSMDEITVGQICGDLRRIDATTMEARQAFLEASELSLTPTMMGPCGDNDGQALVTALADQCTCAFGFCNGTSPMRWRPGMPDIDEGIRATRHAGRPPSGPC